MFRSKVLFDIDKNRLNKQKFRLHLPVRDQCGRMSKSRGVGQERCRSLHDMLMKEQLGMRF